VSNQSSTHRTGSSPPTEIPQVLPSAPVAVHANSAPRPHLHGQAVGQFGALQKWARRILSNSLLQSPAASLLLRLARKALAVLRELHAAAAEPSAADQPHCTHLMQQAHRILDSIEQHTSALEQAATVVLDLSKICRTLLDRQPRTWKLLLPELLRLAGADRGQTTPIDVWPCFAAGPLMEMQLAAAADAAGLLHGVQTARVLMQTVREDADWAPRVPFLAATALLQDLGTLHVNGLLAVERRHDEQLRHRLMNLHPVISAAAVGSIIGAPAELAMVIAQHHERCDGGGFPRRLDRHRMMRAARLLAAANRFVELGESGAAVETFASADEQAAYALDRLEAEAAAGWWDASCVRLLAAAWRPAPVEVEPEIASSDVGTGRKVGAPEASPSEEATSALRLDGRESGPAERHSAAAAAVPRRNRYFSSHR
jgi:hypothetical protein